MCVHELDSTKPRIAIVGPTGLVGQETLKILQSRSYPSDQITHFGSPRSRGTTIRYGLDDLVIHGIDQIADGDFDFALLCATSDAARRVRELVSDTDTTLIDHSAAFRMENDVPLIIPEVNSADLESHHRVIANPNCSTIMLLSAAEPIRKQFGIEQLIVTTYQAVSGAGKTGIDELHAQTSAYLENKLCEPRVFPCSSGMNIFEHESEQNPITLFNGEEEKIINETKKIWNEPSARVLPTCVRVPVERAHSQSVIIELSRSARLNEIRSVLDQDGLKVLESGELLTPRMAAYQDDVYIGRIRIDPESDGKRVLIWICADQIRKGAALNAIQIMDLVQEKRKSMFVS